MGSQYKFETEQFGITEISLNLLRNRFNYLSIDFKDINSITIEKGNDLKNWLLVLIIGLGLLSYVVYDLISMYIFFTNNDGGVIYIERLLMPLFPLLLGIYSVIISFRKALIMKVHVKKKRFYFSLRDLTKKGIYSDFVKEIKIIYPEIKIND